MRSLGTKGRYFYKHRPLFLSRCPSAGIRQKGKDMTKRDKNGQYQRGNNGDKVCRVYLMGGCVSQMTKDEMYEIADNTSKKVIYQDGYYCIVSEDVYRAVKQPEWREAKRVARNRKAVEDSYGGISDKENDKTPKKTSRRIAEISVGDYYDSMQEKAGYAEGPEDILCKKEMLADLYAALDTLSDRDKEIMRLFSFKYTDAAIGERIGMSQRGVNKRKRVLLAKLKEILEKLL